MERKEAIDVIKKNWPDSSFTMLREALETLIPEIKGSEDERIKKWLINYFREVCDNVAEKEKNAVLSWLEKQGKISPVLSNSSNTGKVEQKPAAWSEEDERMYKKIETAIDSYYAPFSRDAEEMSEWLKSLKERYTWKPSDEQVRAIDVVRGMSNRYSNDTLKALESLYQDLKKLREE